MSYGLPRPTLLGLGLLVLLAGCDLFDPVPVPEGIPFGDYSACVQTEDGPVSIYVYTVQSGGTLAGDGLVNGNATVYRHLGDDQADDPASTYYIKDGSRYRSEVTLPFADDGGIPGRLGPTIGGSFTIEGRTSLDGRIPDRIEGSITSTAWGTHDVVLGPNGAAGCAPRDA